jgi:integrase
MAKVRRRGQSYILDYRIDGKRERLTFKDKSEAHDLCDKYNALKRAERLSEFYALLNARQALVDAEIKLTGKSLRDAMAEYGETCSKGKSYQSQRNERADFKALYDFLCEDPRRVHFLREVTPQMLEEYQGRLLRKVSPSTSNRRFSGYKHFFTKCVEWGYLEKSPTRFLKKRKETPNPRKTFADIEVEMIADALPEYLARPFMFFATAGVRPGEGLSPRFHDWNRAEKTIRVESAKNAGVKRTVYLNDAAQSVLEEIACERVNASPSDFIFLNTQGRVLRPAVLTEAVRHARRQLGIEEGKTPYGLRHTFATKHARLDVSSEKTKRLMGHSSITTTEKYYKLGESELRDTVEKAARVFDFKTKKEVESVTDGHACG